MIDPTTLGAIRLPRLPVEMEHVRDIEGFDGPLLSEFRSHVGECYLFYWCDGDAICYRWLVIRTRRSDLASYMLGRSSLLSLIVEGPDRFVYIVDRESNAAPDTVWFTGVDVLPERYKPDPTARADRWTASVPAELQDVYIDPTWGPESATVYPRKYLQAYAFSAAFGLDGDASGIAMNYKPAQGWVIHTMYRQLRKDAPGARVGSLEAIEVSSPGFMRFRVDSETAAGLRASILAYRLATKEIDYLLGELRAWARGSRSDEDVDEAQAEQMIRRVCSLVGIDATAIMRGVGDPRFAQKAIASFVARLEFLSKQDAAGHAVLLGLRGDAQE